MTQKPLAGNWKERDPGIEQQWSQAEPRQQVGADGTSKSTVLAGVPSEAGQRALIISRLKIVPRKSWGSVSQH